MAKVTKETPLMKQYNQIKAKYPDALLLKTPSKHIMYSILY